MPLHIALVLSLVLHLLLYSFAHWAGLQAPPAPPARPLIEAMLILPEIAAEPLPELQAADALTPPVEAPVAVTPAGDPIAPEPTLPPPVQPPPATATAAVVPQVAAKPRSVEPERPRFYPREAVLRGLEGEVLVSVVLDGSGNVRTARLDRSSGHPILDAAAVRAARTMKALPGEAGPAVLPVRFNLR